MNTRLRKGFVHFEQNLALIGPKIDLSYSYDHLGDDSSLINDITSGKHPISKKLQLAKRPVIIVGSDTLSRPDGANILSSLRTFANTLSPEDKTWKSFNVLQKNASQVAALDIGYTPGPESAINGNTKVLFLLGADSPAIQRDQLPKDCFIIYQGHHGDAGAEIADVVLPGAAYTEKQGTYVNTEGRAQQTLVAVTPPGLAREDWKIIRALSAVLGDPLPYDTLDQVRDRLADVAPHLIKYNHLEPNNFNAQFAELGKVSFFFKFFSIPIFFNLNYLLVNHNKFE